MADTTTTNLGMVKPEAGTGGWNTKIDGNLDLLDTYLGDKRGAAFDPNVSYLGAAKVNQVLACGTTNPRIWRCVTAGTPGVWVLEAVLLGQDLDDLALTWTKAQKYAWTSAAATTLSGTLSLTSDATAYALTLDTNCVIDIPTGLPALGFQFIYLLVDGPSTFSLTWDAAFVFPGDVVPDAPESGARHFYTLRPDPAGIWHVSYEVGF